MTRAGIFAIAAAALCGQTVAPRFEVASIHRHLIPAGQPVYRRANGSLAANIKGNRITGQMLTLTELIGDAYGVRGYQILGAPDWAKPGDGAEYYDLEAKAPGDASPSLDQVRAMMQALLAERFQLELSRQSQELNVYSLTVSKGGSKLQDAASAWAALLAKSAGDGVTLMRSDLPLLITLISSRVDRPVIDRTGLAGTYIYPWHGNPPEDASIFTLLEDELGLKLEPGRAPIDMLKIERAERPTGN